MTTTLVSPRELRQRAEEIFRVRNSSIPDVRSPDEAKQILYNLRVHQIQLEMQNEELRRIQDDLDASHARYFDLYDLAPVGYLTLSNKKMIREVNLAAATMFGVARSLLVREPIGRILPQEYEYQNLF
jgi:PAS domain-containing protein